MDRKKLSVEDDSIEKIDIRSIGEILRQKRKELNLTLKEAENATSIRISYLQALEEGEMTKLISPIYAQGFLRQYASYLGLDGDKLIRDNPNMFVRPDTQEFSYGIGTLEVRGNPGAGVKWFPNFVWIVVFILICLAGWYLAKFAGIM